MLPIFCPILSTLRTPWGGTYEPARTGGIPQRRQIHPPSAGDPQDPQSAQWIQGAGAQPADRHFAPIHLPDAGDPGGVRLCAPPGNRRPILSDPSGSGTGGRIFRGRVGDGNRRAGSGGSPGRSGLADGSRHFSQRRHVSQGNHAPQQPVHHRPGHRRPAPADADLRHGPGLFELLSGVGAGTHPGRASEIGRRVRPAYSPQGLCGCGDRNHPRARLCGALFQICGGNQNLHHRGAGDER